MNVRYPNMWDMQWCQNKTLTPRDIWQARLTTMSITLLKFLKKHVSMVSMVSRYL